MQAIKDPLGQLILRPEGVNTEGLCIHEGGHGKAQDRFHRRVAVRASVARTHKHGKDEGKARLQRI